MSAHYRTKLNFTWEALSGSQTALKKLYSVISGYKGEEGAIHKESLERFEAALEDDLNIPQAIATVWDVLKSPMSEGSKVLTLLKFDEVLGLGLENYVGYEIPQRVVDLAKTRQEYRKNGIWDKADLIRREIEELGFVVEDTSNNSYKIKKKL